MKETAIEVKVGALVLFSLALLVGFVFVLGDFSLGKGFTFYVEFENAGGLKPGADVAIAGLNVGNVKNLEFIETNAKADAKSSEPMNAVAVRATVSIEQRFASSVRENSEFFITTRGVLGEPYIEIVTEDFDKPAIATNAVLRGVDPPRLDLVVSRAMRLLEIVTDLLENPEISTKSLLSNAATLVRTINEILTENREDIDGTIKGVHSSADEASKLLTSLNVAVEDGEGLRDMIGDLRIASNDLRSTARNAKRLASSVNGRLDPILDDVEKTASNAREVSEAANRIVTTNEPKINESLDNVRDATANLKLASEDAQVLVRQIKDGEGTVGLLLNDREVYDDLKELMRQIKQKPWKIIWKE